MRIAFLVTRSDVLGGASLHVRDLAREFLARGDAVIVLVGGEGAFTDLLRRDGIPTRSLRNLVRPIHPLRDIAAVIELRRALQEFRPDILAAHSAKAGMIGRAAGKINGIPTVFTAHGWSFAEGMSWGRRKFAKWCEFAARPLTSKIITVSDADRKLAVAHGVALETDMETIYYGIPDVADRLRASPSVDPPRLLMVARFEAQKDHRTLVTALAGLRHLPWILDLVGDGPLRSDVKKQARELGIDDRTNFLGARTDVAEILAQSQVFVLISNWEGLPISILEAMRAGLPVVASGIAGTPDAVRDGVSGFLIPRGDAVTLADALQKLIADPTLRSRFGEAGRREYEARFTLFHMFSRTADLYEHVVNTSRRSEASRAPNRSTISGPPTKPRTTSH